MQGVLGLFLERRVLLINKNLLDKGRVIMAKCNRCGRKGLFFKVNSEGLCKDCAVAVAEDRQEFKELERDRIRRELEQKVRTEQQKAEQPISSTGTITVTVDYNGYPDIIITSNNKHLIKALVEKYTTVTIDDNFADWYGFQSVFVSHEYSDNELSERTKYIAYNMLNSLGGLKYWIDNANDHKKWFDYYAELLQLLPQLSEFEPYFKFNSPLPHELYKKYMTERDKYTKEFIERWWQRVINQAASLKTIEGRKNKIDNFYKELMTYKEFISDNNLQFVDKLKSETNLDTIKKIEKPLPEFDSQKEQELLNMLKNSIGNSLNEHFAYIELQNFYYKYRKNDQTYLELCKQYCQKDIAILPQVDRDYITERTQTLKKFISYCGSDSKETKLQYENDLERVRKYGFLGRIPAFKRMSIICENEKDFDGAISYCDMEIEHLLSHGSKQDSDSVNEVSKRREKLIAKKDKFLNGSK